MKIIVSTVVEAPLDEVWRAYTTPDDIKAWNTASPDWHTTASTVDLRPGGKFSSRMEAKDGSFGFDFAGEYTKVIPHQLIEYAFGDRTGTVDFTSGEGGVKVTVTFDGEQTHSEEQQRTGWQAILDNFARHVEGKLAPQLSPNAQLVSTIFEEVAKGNGAPFWEACHDDIVWRTIGNGSWSGEFAGKQTIIDEIFRPLNRVLVERATIPGRLIDGGEVIVLQAKGKNLTRDGQRYDNDYAFVIHFRDGKISRYEEYCDTELIARVLPDRDAAKSNPKPA